VAPARKTDPGELFPWPELAEYGIGAWPGSSPPLAGEASAARVTDMLIQFGYGVSPEVDVSLETAIAAFQRHFRPGKIDGIADHETAARLAALGSHTE
jgi:N-acetylmuramoyl-L-alanine amidase